jgi:hypothetical protein
MNSILSAYHLSMPQDPNDSSQGFPFFDQIAKAMASSGPVQWDMARQFAMMTATNCTYRRQPTGFSC